MENKKANYKQIRECKEELGKHRDKLTKQQFKTILGQIKSGQVEAAYKGMSKLLGNTVTV